MAVRTSDEPLSLAEIGRRVAARIDSLLAAESVRWSQVDASLSDPIDALRAFVAGGGKRLRPSFCHWGYVAAGGDAESIETVDAGAAIELLHASALVHDDVIDGSTLRRGRPSVHVEFAARHRQEGWHGEATRFGEGAAILAGNLAHVYADQLMRGAPEEAADVFGQLRLEVNAGQYLDLVVTASGEADERRARTIAVYKSGKYTVERPLHLGAALRRRLDEVAGPLSRYGLPLGEAFQLRDDLLGAFGDESTLGKRVGEDFREGKPTALFAMARGRAAGAARRLLERRYGQPDLTDEDVAALQAVMEETGARTEVERRVEALADEAIASLAGSGFPARARAELALLASFIIDRDR